MVLSLILCHVFKFPAAAVVNTYEKTKVTEVDGFVREVEETAPEVSEGPLMRCKQWRITRKNYFPRFFQRDDSLKVDEIELHEEIWYYPDDNKYWIRSHNLTWFEDATICRTAYVTNHENNIEWSSWEEEIVIDFGSFGKLGTILELFMRRTRVEAFKVQTKFMENCLKNNVV